ncbi:hypothetical protein ACR2E0_001613 [Phascolarctobacterium faecium]|uniref:hypothetical protein n=1 Tax=Phascolarctobacterium faecium TaxID=33025 RepID=UPI003F74A262
MEWSRWDGIIYHFISILILILEKNRRAEMTNYERIKAMSIEEMAAFVEAAGRNNCQKICVYRQGSENCKKLPCQTGIKHWLERESK